MDLVSAALWAKASHKTSLTQRRNVRKNVVCFPNCGPQSVVKQPDPKSAAIVTRRTASGCGVGCYQEEEMDKDERGQTNLGPSIRNAPACNSACYRSHERTSSCEVHDTRFRVQWRGFRDYEIPRLLEIRTDVSHQRIYRMYA